MNSIKKYLEMMQRYPFSKTRALEQELEAVRKSHDLVSGDLEKLRETLQHAREADTKRLVDLQQQVSRFEQERDDACRQADQLNRALADAEQHRTATETDVSLLKTKLDEERSIARVKIEELEHALTEAEQRQKSMEAHVALLESRIEEERGNTRKQVEQLDRTLADAEQRQRSTQAHVGSLESMLAEERSAHKAGIVATESFIAQFQSEQETRLKMQSELMNTLQDVVLRLQGTMQFERERPRASLPKLMLMAIALFVTGVLAAAFILQSREDTGRGLAKMQGELSDMSRLVMQQFDRQDGLLNELVQAHARQVVAVESASVEERPPVSPLATRETEQQTLHAAAFEPDFRALQAGLIDLGFDLGMSRPDGEPGIKTRQALEEFRRFYLPDDPAPDGIVSEALAALILKSADRVRADATHFNVGSDVLAAIRMGSIRTGVDFSFLMELAKVESNFNPAARAPRSSAAGLYQFKDQEWLEAVRTFGADYGLEDYARRLEPINDEEVQEQQPLVRDPLQMEVLSLRFNPRLSTLMAAENIKRNLRLLSDQTQHEPGRTELYLAHYLGPNGAVRFLQMLTEAPSTVASTLFPEEAARNPVVFAGGRHPRTVAQVYQWFDRRFNTTLYDERNPS